MSLGITFFQLPLIYPLNVHLICYPPSDVSFDAFRYIAYSEALYWPFQVEADRRFRIWGCLLLPRLEEVL